MRIRLGAARRPMSLLGIVVAIFDNVNNDRVRRRFNDMEGRVLKMNYSRAKFTKCGSVPRLKTEANSFEAHFVCEIDL